MGINDRYDRIAMLDQVIARANMEIHHQAYQALMQKAYLHKSTPNCLCRAPEPIPMYIARMGDTYIVKRCPKTGHLHHPECESHGGISTAAHAIYSDDALTERADGKVSHNLAVPLSTIEQVTGITLDEAAAPPLPDMQRTKRSTMTLRGFLNLLWEEAGLHTWSPGMAGKRNLGRVYWGLRSQLADRLIGGEDAMARVFIPEAKISDEQDKKTLATLHERFDQMQKTYGDTRKGILIVVAELRQLQATAHNTAIRLKGLPGNSPIWTPRQSVARLQSQFAHGLVHFEKTPAHDYTGWAKADKPKIFVIAGIQRSKSGSLLWCYGAAMETTAQFIPVDSGHEFRIANLLTEQQRRFEKPLRYDGATATFPDFVL
ncbi:MAG: DUF1173 family protein, partial [Rhodoferax sp.]|uniref:DUF1173 family protein n=1 Tax=Rhodoferax sp. TaxID=50421 RepID=UPI0026392357